MRWEVIMRSLLWQVGRRKVYRNALERQREANPGQGRSHALLRFGDRLVGGGRGRRDRGGARRPCSFSYAHSSFHFVLSFLSCVALLLPAAKGGALAPSTDEKRTRSNWRDAQATHASIEWRVDFDREVLKGAVTYDVTNKSSASTFVVDTHSGLTIHKAYVDNVEAEVLLGKPHAIFGVSAAVPLPPAKKTCQVRFEYSTAPECSAAQWLSPAQTAGKKRPYLFTQSQAIHARALLPCQDAPGAKMSWDAVVDAPQWATALMSGLRADALPFIHKKCPPVQDGYRSWFWKQPVPTSSYLIAVVVADLEARDISERCRVWSEPSVVDKALHEFSETEQFLRAAEDITGQDYVWKRYDLVCLAPSFPYGGMENPCLTFVTPTLLAGDRSLAGVVAHEIAHSWTGNLVTNATWEHFWLNEGWTR